MTILDTILDYPPSSTSSHHIFRCWWWWHDGGRFLSEEMSGIKMLRVQNFGLVVLWIRDEERLSSSSSIIYNELLYDDINLSCCFRDDHIVYDTSSQTRAKITWPVFQPMLFWSKSNVTLMLFTSYLIHVRLNERQNDPILLAAVHCL